MAGEILCLSRPLRIGFRKPEVSKSETCPALCLLSLCFFYRVLGLPVIMLHTLAPSMPFVSIFPDFHKPNLIFFLFHTHRNKDKRMVSVDGTQFLWLLWIPAKSNPPQTYLGGVYYKYNLICSSKESLEAHLYVM